MLCPAMNAVDGLAKTAWQHVNHPTIEKIHIASSKWC